MSSRKVSAITLTILFFVIFLVNCNTKKQKITQLWVRKYDVEFIPGDTVVTINDDGIKSIRIIADSNALYIDTVTTFSLFDFTEDTLKISVFHETYYDYFMIHEATHHIQDDSLFLHFHTNSKPHHIDKLDESELVLFYSARYDEYHEKNVRMFLRTLDRYGLGVRKKEFDDLLISNRVEIRTNGNKARFTPPSRYEHGRIIAEEKDVKFGLSNKWCTREYQDELFLIMGKDVIHVKSISRLAILGIIYGVRDEEIVLNIM